jgi:hypothetical protein
MKGSVLSQAKEVEKTQKRGALKKLFCFCQLEP